MKKSEKTDPIQKNKTLRKKNSTEKNQIKSLGNKDPNFFFRKNKLSSQRNTA